MNRITVSPLARASKYLAIALLLFFVAEVLAAIGVYEPDQSFYAASQSLDEPRDPLTGAAYLPAVQVAPSE